MISVLCAQQRVQTHFVCRWLCSHSNVRLLLRKFRTEKRKATFCLVMVAALWVLRCAPRGAGTCLLPQCTWMWGKLWEYGVQQGVRPGS